jgi:hypothetical protein
MVKISYASHDTDVSILGFFVFLYTWAGITSKILNVMLNVLFVTENLFYFLKNMDLCPVFRIRIHLIRIRIQHFGSIATIYLSLGLYKGRPSYRRSLQLSKENIQRHEISYGSGFRIRIRIH